MSWLRLPNDDLLWNARPHGMTPEDYARRRDLARLAGWRDVKQFALFMGATALPSDEAIERMLSEWDTYDARTRTPS